MAHGDKDSRVGAGQMLAGSVRQATLSIPCDCMCTWTVVRTGPGMEAISELRYSNSLCSRLREHQAAAARPPAVTPWLQGSAAGAHG
jgi:hypothetical protein